MASFYSEVSDTTNSKLLYKNVYYALAIAFEKYISSLILNNDLTRVICSSTEYALVKRSGQNTWNNANLPFVNYKLNNKDTGGQRQWFSNELYSQGLFIEELGIKLRMIPVSFSLDCTYWSGRDDDYQYATDKLLFEKSAESKLSFNLDFEGNLVKDIGIINYNLDMNPRFQESDWLQKNNIFAFGLDSTIQTFIFQSNTKGYCIPKTVLLDFLTKKKIIKTDSEVTSYEQAITLTVDQINGTITQS